MSAPDVGDLIRRAQEGEPRAFERLIAHHVPQVRRFVRTFANSEQDADDLAQDVLVRVYLSIRSFRFQAAFSTWVFRVARNVCIDASRRRTRRATHAEAHHDESAQTSTDDPPALQDSALEQKRRHAILWDALGQLPPKFSSPIVLFDIEGLSYGEVAAIEGVPIGTIRSRLARGRKRLRRTLEAISPGNRFWAEFVIQADDAKVDGGDNRAAAANDS